MTHYVIGLVDVTDPDGLDDYGARAAQTIAQHGGRILFAGPVTRVLEGAVAATAGAVVEFADEAAATAWLDSPHALRRAQTVPRQAEHRPPPVLVHTDRTDG